MTIKQLSEMIHLSMSTIYKRTSAHKIPHIKIGGKLLFVEEEIMDWLQKYRQETAENLQDQVNTHFSHLNRHTHGKS